VTADVSASTEREASTETGVGGDWELTLLAGSSEKGLGVAVTAAGMSIHKEASVSAGKSSSV
jgi:hypothetical protein